MDTLSKILQAARAGPRCQTLPPSDEIFESVATAVADHMSKYDASHDFNHVLRVTALSQVILTVEATGDESYNHDPTIVLLAALLHDVTDKKYATNAAEDESKLDQIMKNAGLSLELRKKVSVVVNHVSYSTETRNPDQTRRVLSQYPELGIVQDADRLDAIGAIGIGRTFTFGGAKMPQSSMQSHREHLSDKLEKLEAMMKTKTGRQMARERTERIQLFAKWWDEESMMVN